MRVAVIRVEQFTAAHRLYNPAWSDERNFEVFGVCANPNYHGHNYKLEVRIAGEVDPETGFVFNLAGLKKLIREHIIDPFDHKNLNLDVEEFKNLNPTAENIAIVIYNILRARLPEHLDLRIRLYETPRNIIEYPA